MYAAIAVSAGKLRSSSSLSRKFPELTGRAAELYEQAYGKDILDKYPQLVSMTNERYIPETYKVDYRHIPAYDVESFFWVLLRELVTAYPQGEKHDGMTEGAREFLETMEAHRFKVGEHDARKKYLHRFMRTSTMEDLLHPRLQKLAPYLVELSQYLFHEWAYFGEDRIPADHAHEAMKRVLLKMLLEIEDDPIELKVGIERQVSEPNGPINPTYDPWIQHPETADSAQTPANAKSVKASQHTSIHVPEPAAHPAGFNRPSIGNIVTHGKKRGHDDQDRDQGRPADDVRNLNTAAYIWLSKKRRFGKDNAGHGGLGSEADTNDLGFSKVDDGGIPHLQREWGSKEKRGREQDQDARPPCRANAGLCTADKENDVPWQQTLSLALGRLMLMKQRQEERDRRRNLHNVR
jgi:hypothetical protein